MDGSTTTIEAPPRQATDIIEPVTPAVGSQPVSTIVAPPLPPSEPQGAAEAPVAQESLRDKYAKLSERFRELGTQQFERNLTPDEIRERQQLESLAGAGLFEPTLSDSQIAAKEQVLKAQTDAQGDSQALAEEYRGLGKKLYDQGLKGAELERYNRLSDLAKRHVFEL